jgi:cardiolipin synthase A/B
MPQGPRSRKRGHVSRSLIVLPEDSSQPILDAIHGATESIRTKIFILSDPGMLKALIQAHNRGVKVRVMLNPVRRDGQRQNDHSRRALSEAGIEVSDSNPAFDVTHEKSMVVDDTRAFVQSLNWAAQNFAGTRDYAVITSHGDEVREIIDCFEADWSRQEFPAGEDSRLIWCPCNGRQRIARFIASAQRSLFIENARYQDAMIVEQLVRAQRRGVKVHVLTRPPHSLKTEKLIEGVAGLRIMQDVGVKIHKLKHLRLHGKVWLADDLHAIVGSIILSPGSFDKRRELAIEMNDGEILHRLRKVVHHDWKESLPLDLTDQGLLADFEKHHKEGAGSLGLLDNHRHRVG